MTNTEREKDDVNVTQPKNLTYKPSTFSTNGFVDNTFMNLRKTHEF